MSHRLHRVCVYAASSRNLDTVYLEAAAELGRELAKADVDLVFGGGRVGLMGAVADAALEAGGRAFGVLPRFMRDIEWGHERLTEMYVVETMHERKSLMIELADGFIALPGGCGTLEELFEAITWKRLGLHGKPIALLNVRGYFDPCAEMLERCIREGFMSEAHGAMWGVAEEPGDVLDLLRSQPEWDASMRSVARP